MSVTLGTVRQATGTEAVVAFLEERILPATGWHLVEARRRSVRLEPPQAYWAVYRVRLGRGALDGGDGATDWTASWAESRELRLVARAVFDDQLWREYSDRLRELFGGATCDPLNGLGYPALFEDTQHAVWFYPVDPGLHGLARCADPARMRRLFRSTKHAVLEHPGRITDVRIEMARYLPEIAAVLRYEIETQPAGAARTIYGKVQHSRRGERAHRVMEQLWRVARDADGLLTVPRPLAYDAELGLLLQSAVSGTPVSGDRTAPIFLAAAESAGRALAVIHQADVAVDHGIEVEDELDRLANTVDQFRFVHPRAHVMLRDLLGRIRGRLERTSEEERLLTHGDLKYDQLIFDGERFSIIDFDYSGMAETSFDLGKFCAHLVPSSPQSWEDGYAAEEARRAFLDAYCEMRPDATLQRFPVYEAINLANRSMSLMWSQMRDWEYAVETMLSLALERLNTPL